MNGNNVESLERLVDSSILTAMPSDQLKLLNQTFAIDFNGNVGKRNHLAVTASLRMFSCCRRWPLSDLNSLRLLIQMQTERERINWKSNWQIRYSTYFAGIHLNLQCGASVQTLERWLYCPEFASFDLRLPAWLAHIIDLKKKQTLFSCMQWIGRDWKCASDFLIKLFDFRKKFDRSSQNASNQAVWSGSEETSLKVTEFKVGASSEAFEFRQWILPDRCSWWHWVRLWVNQFEMASESFVVANCSP